MRSNRPRAVLTIQQPLETQDAAGAVQQEWQTYHQARGHYKPLTGREKYSDQQFYASGDALFTLRFKAGVTAKMRLLMNGRVFDIIAPPVDVQGRGRELEITAREHA